MSEYFIEVLNRAILMIPSFLFGLSIGMQIKGRKWGNMRNIAEIIKDDRNGKKLSQTERQIAVAYIQGKYDAVRELKIDKIRAEIEELKPTNPNFKGYYEQTIAINKALDIFDKYKAESEDK